MINRVVLVGRATRDPELRKTNSGNSVCSFTIAIDNRMKNPDGTKSTSFIPCTVFTNQAENVAKFVKKGSLIGVEGRLNQRSYVKQDGSKASILEVLADSVQFLEPKAAVPNEEPEIPPFDDGASNDNESKNLDSLDPATDDLPF